MSTVDKDTADRVVAGEYHEDGWERIVQYTNAWGGVSYGLENLRTLGRYSPSEYVRNPRGLLDARRRPAMSHQRPPLSPACTFDNPATGRREIWRMGVLQASFPAELLRFIDPHVPFREGAVYGQVEAIPPDHTSGMYQCPYCFTLSYDLRLCCGELHGQRLPNHTNPKE